MEAKPITQTLHWITRTMGDVECNFGVVQPFVSERIHYVRHTKSI